MQTVKAAGSASYSRIKVARISILVCNTDMSVDFEKEITEIADMVEPPECEVHPAVIQLAAQALEDVDAKYGPGSDNPLSYHNAQHSLDVCRRGVRLANIIYPYIRPKYRSNTYDLVVVDGSTHDIEQNLGPGKNEKASADYAISKIDAIDDPVINNDEFKKRSDRGTIATTVERKEDGELVQANIQSGVHDPIKFIMAFADINGIAMEGEARMFKDATSLCYELFDDPSIDDLYNFYVNQATFLRQRLNDGRIKSDIAYYFPDDIESVYGEMRKAFNSNIVSAHGVAILLGKRPELKSALSVPFKTLDKSILGSAIGEALKQHLA